MSGTIGISPAQVDAATAIPAFRLGTVGRLESDDGTKEYVYVRAGEAITGVGYACLIYGSAFDVAMIDSTSSAVGQGARAGVAPAAILDNEYFWLQVYGRCSIRTLANAAVGVGLASTATPGALDDAATTGLEPVFGAFIGTLSGGAAETNVSGSLSYPVIGPTIL